MIIRLIWAIWLSFWNQPKLIPTLPGQHQIEERRHLHRAAGD